MITSTLLGSSVRLHKMLVAAAVMVPMVIGVVAAGQNRTDVLRDEADTMERIMLAQIEHALRVFDVQALALAQINDQLASVPWAAISTPSTKQYLDQVKSALQDVAAIWVTDSAGKVHAASSGFDPSIAETEPAMAPIDGGRDAGNSGAGNPGAGIYVEPPSSKATDQAVFSISRHRSTADGTGSAIHIAVRTEPFVRFFRDAGRSLDHVALLLRNDGKILVREPARDSATELSPASPLRQRIVTQSTATQPTTGGSFVAPTGGGGPERLYAYRQVGSYPVFVTYSVKTDILLEKWRSNLLVYGMVAGGAALVLLLVSLLALRRAKAEQAAIAELRQEVAHRQIAEAQLRQAQKMEAVGQLTGGLAHDFNNLLSVIGGNADLLIHRGTAPEQTRLAEAIRRAAERGAALTRQLLAFSRLQKLDVITVDLNQRIHEMQDMLRRSLRANITIETELQEGLWPLRVDGNQLELAILNIAVNARDAMTGGGTLTIRTQNVELDRHQLKGNFVSLSLQDTGIGMDAEQRERAFEPFFTTKEVGKGTGLGLSMVYGFINQSGGGVDIESEPGAGCTITLYLPQAVEHGSAATQSPAAAVRNLPKGGTVLIVEDDEEVQQVTTAFIEALGYQARSVTAAEQALDLLGSGAIPQLVISDMYMPGGMGGLELALELRRRFPALPTLLVTGASEAADEARDSGFTVLMKPFRQADLQVAMVTAWHATSPGARRASR
ncbi:MAG TPA: ATP-binding protein [Stellaceae bacterium]|nr:ATP-binding protein [Stellaceae bacterium]